MNLLTILFMSSRPSFTMSSGLKPLIFKLLTALEKKLFIVSVTCFSVEIILSLSNNVMFLPVLLLSEKNDFTVFQNFLLSVILFMSIFA